MKRRSFLRKSLVTSALAASPLAMSGLVNASGNGGGGSGNTTTWIETTEWTETTTPTYGCAFTANHVGGYDEQGKRFNFDCVWTPSPNCPSDTAQPQICGTDRMGRDVEINCDGVMVACYRLASTNPSTDVKKSDDD